MRSYKYYVFDNKVVCVSKDNNGTFKGIAQCADTDTFDEEYGKRLARLRCDRQRFKASARFHEEEVQRYTKEAESLLDQVKKQVRYSRYARTEIDGYDELLRRELENPFSVDMQI